MSVTISGSTRLSRLFSAYPQLLDIMVGQSPLFQRLRNPLLRRAMTPLTSVEQAAQIAGLDPGTLVNTLRAAVGQPAAADPAPPPPGIDAGESHPPAWLDAPSTATLDVRDAQRTGQPVLDPILETVKTIQPGQRWTLRSEFEPLPLYALLQKKGFDHWTIQRAPDDWEIHFYRRDEVAVEPEPAPPPAPTPRHAAATLDVRDLPPPEPMQRILEVLATLRPGEWLHVHHARRPVYLLPLLEQQGHHHECEPRADGTVDFWVRKGEDDVTRAQ
jgi:uncharacterized protein (DUF2249 family)